MTEISAPAWSILQRLVESCEDSLLICSPWISTEGVQQLGKFLAQNTRIKSIEIWTRITELDTDSRSLRELIRTLSSRDVAVVIRDSNALHLKVYLADQRAVIFGSANLTHSGFQLNSEIVAYTSDPVLVEQVISVLNGVYAVIVTDLDLDEFISTELPLLEAHAASLSAQPKVETPWRNRPYARTQEVVHAGTGRRAFLFGSDFSSHRVQEIVKIADWRSRSINIYNLIDGSWKKISPASEAEVQYYTERGIEIKEPYMREGLTAEWVEYGRKAARERGLSIGE